ncbi:MAG: ABC transporter ATP-binding protein [Nitrospirae bacterium]|nr:ABC transporter ATP-binding protein [Nitrospirota bacterium]
MIQSLLSVEDLSISFASEIKSLNTVNEVSFKAADQDFLGIVGESGCGKTLTALAIMKLLPSNAISSGRILFEGKDILAYKDKDLQKIRGSKISMIFQEPMTSLNPVFTVGNQIAEVLITHQSMSAKEAINKTIELLKVVQIPSPELRVNDYPHQMSGGMRQRVMIAMAVACKPSLLIADEPTTALDVTIQAQILELLGSLQERNRMSLLFITHDLGIVAEYASRVMVMYAGRIVEKSPVQDMFINPRHPYTIGLLESLPGKKGAKLKPIPGQVPNTESLPSGCKFRTRCRYVIEECHLKEPSLKPAGNSEHLSRCIRAMEL